MNLVYTHEHTVIMYSMKNLLEANGIDCFFLNHYSNPVASCELWLSKSDDYDKTLSIIKDNEVNN